MSQEIAVPMFSCGSCGKSFKWKPAIAGKSAKCACGSKVSVPATDPSAAAPKDDDSDLIDFGGFDAIVPLAEAPKVAAAVPTPTWAKKAAAPAAKGVPGPKGGGGGPKMTKSGQLVGHQRLPSESVQDRAASMSFWGAPSERVVPMIMLGVSAMVYFGAAAAEFGSGLMVAVAFAYGLFSVAAMTAAAFVTAAIGGLSFGFLGIAVLRFSAISFACLAVNGVFDLFNIPAFANSLVTFAIYTGCMMKFFGLEFAEARFVAFVSAIMKFILAILFVMVVVGGLMGGSAAMGGDDEEDQDLDMGAPTTQQVDEAGTDEHQDEAKEAAPARRMSVPRLRFRRR